MYDILELSKKLLPELREIGKELNIKRVESFKKQDLIYKILDNQAILASGIKKPEIKVLPRLIKNEESEIITKDESVTPVPVTDNKAVVDPAEVVVKKAPV
jgi:transcription termination factor Rho